MLSFNKEPKPMPKIVIIEKFQDYLGLSIKYDIQNSEILKLLY